MDIQLVHQLMIFLKTKNINLDIVKEKISKNQKLLLYATDGKLLDLKKLLQRKKLI